jgi:hypothetical protein
MRKTILACLVMACAMVSGSRAHAIVIPLGNLFDDPTSETLANAIASDSFGAVGTVGDLGVYNTVLGNMHVAVNIAPGVNFNFANIGADASVWQPAFNDSAYGGGSIIRTTGVAMGTYTQAGLGNGEEQGIGMHANQTITFDLNAIRAAGALTGYGFTFTGDGGLNDDTGSRVNMAVVVSDANGVSKGYVNGVQVATSQAGDWFFSGSLPPSLIGTGVTAAFNVPISATDLYLTLVSTAGGDGYGSDQAVFSLAQLTSVEPPLPAPEPASATLLLCGLALLYKRKRSSV